MTRYFRFTAAAMAIAISGQLDAVAEVKVGDEFVIIGETSGVVEGTAESLEASAETVSVSALGSTSRVDPSKTGQAGLSRGLANASSELKKIYADLVRQSAPVLETGPGKDVTVVITKGSFLEIKKYAQDS